MIRMLVRLGRWLDSRFPEKVVMTVADWRLMEKYIESHNEELSQLRSKLETLEANLTPILSRLSVVESNAVHKGAVQDLVAVVKAVKEEFASLKVGFGINRVGDKELQAMLNGQYIAPEDTTNG